MSSSSFLVRFCSALNVIYLAALSVFLTGLVGCGDSTNTIEVRGNVSYQGQSLPLGSVAFFPTTGRPFSASISDGAYKTEISPGEYVVTVNYSQPPPAGYKEGDPLPQPKFVLPPEYTTRAKSTLTATVTPDQSEPIDFKL